ncbi:DUF4430 domain-containing protein [Patescibacteria group bacterium]|nr:DUF4430 domain-containing protein [Patescibacteria group bacterium]
MNKKTLVVIAVIFVVLVGFGWSVKRQYPARQTQSPSKRLIGVQMKLADETDFKNFNVPDGQTAFDLLNNRDKVVFTGKGSSAYVTSINGKEASASKREYWAFYVNGKLADVGAGSYQLKAGDKIEWKIEKY